MRVRGYGGARRPGPPDPSGWSDNVARNIPQSLLSWERIMRLAFIGKDPDSNPTGSPTVYRTDRDSWIVQGWVVTDPGALAEMNIPEGETAVEIPDRMLPFFQQEHRASRHE
jgi:hypothetical protein